MATIASRKGTTIIALSVPLLTLALPLFDGAFAIFRRAARGGRIFYGDRDHIHHRLLRLGFTPTRAVLSLYLVSVLSASLAIVVATGPSQTIWAVLLLVVLLAWAGVRRLGYAEVTELQRLLTNRLLYTRQTLSRNLRLVQLREDLGRAATTAELWDRLVQAAGDLSLERLEMRLRLPLPPDLAGSLRESPQSAFPIWGRLPANESAGTWTLRVPLVLEHQMVAELHLSFPVSPGSLDFDSRGLVDAVEEGFRACAARSQAEKAPPAREAVVESAPGAVAPSGGF
jgi:hypothetical protein